jgi:hypothetical protein
MSDSEASQAWLVGVGHHAPLTDDDQPSVATIDDSEPVIPDWFHSLDEQHNLSRNFRLYPAHFLSGWSSACQNTNVYRTLRLYPKSSRNEPVVGPFLIDIDNQDWTNGYSENLEDARTIAVRTVELLTSRWDLAEGRDFRVFFSGRKGFNIEMRPTALGIRGSLHDQIRASADRLDEVVRELENGNSPPAGIDRIYGNRFGYRLKHPYVRLHNSWNKWISKGQAKKRLRLKLSAADLQAQPIESLCSRAENGEA